MKTISVSEAKASLSEQLRYIKRGGEVTITDRGRPVARLVPVGDTVKDAQLVELERAGLIRRGTGALPDGFWELRRPSDPDATVRNAVIQEREAGW